MMSWSPKIQNHFPLYITTSVRVSHPIIAAADVAKITLMDNGKKKKKRLKYSSSGFWMSFNESFGCVRNAGLDPYMAMNINACAKNGI